MSVQYLTIEEFHEKHPYLSVATLRRMVREGRIDYLQPRGKGSTILIPEDALDRVVCRASPQDEEVGAGATALGQIGQEQKRRRGSMPNWKQ